MSMIARSTGCPERPHARRLHTRRLRALPSLLLFLVFLAPPLPLVRAQALADSALSADGVSADRVSADAPGWVRERPERVDGEPARVVVSDPLETRAECDENLRGKVERVLQAYAVEHLQRGQLADLRPMEIPAQLVRVCVRESYASTRALSVRPLRSVSGSRTHAHRCWYGGSESSLGVTTFCRSLTLQATWGRALNAASLSCSICIVLADSG